MVNWKDPDLEAKLETLSAQLLYAILGLYGWEYICSSHVEIALLRRKLPFRWPLLSYIVARFSFLIATVLMLTSILGMNLITIVSTGAPKLLFATNAAIGCSTTNLMIRTWLIWKTSYLLRLLLVLLSLGHWTMLTLFLVTTHASTRNGVCIISFVKPAYTSAVIIYSMLYDLALLVFTVIGLLRMPSSSTLWKMLLKQGVIYFILNLVAKVILLVCSWTLMLHRVVADQTL
ncbi:uncharacterized protein F5891DRAFT_958801 [Suillus fuscotomentosus]|uniref:Uncharacterized protein n=1 Tax=Suillus fuscotomentosus TaxID=1912939 RepID=A0AAD4HG42_9AGAM|nr:uncharacterized protein F5891DRAFT_958801 [Suillus fuscotomentosus]KAG1896355.1 hypothetical protein F5891DRAFT_958801 [Suillus fuscotomentosus]